MLFQLYNMYINDACVDPGEDDTMIRSVWGAQTGAFLTLRGFDVHHKTYRDLDHEIGVQEVFQSTLLAL